MSRGSRGASGLGLPPGAHGEGGAGSEHDDDRDPSPTVSGAWHLGGLASEPNERSRRRPDALDRPGATVDLLEVDARAQVPARACAAALALALALAPCLALAVLGHSTPPPVGI